jgi:hypothetical protein
MSPFNAAAAGAAIAVLSGMATQAKALDVGQCFSMADMKLKLLAEGQQYIAFANEPVVDQNKMEVRVFTSDIAGNVGYVLSGNQPKEAVSTQACVELRLQNVHIFDARMPGVDSAALVNEDRPAAMRQCETLQGCNIHGQFLADQEKAGYRVMLQGTLMHRQPDGTYSPGNLATLTGQMDNKKMGALAYTSKAGAYTIATAFIDIAYSPYALRILDGRQGGAERR